MKEMGLTKDDWEEKEGISYKENRPVFYLLENCELFFFSFFPSQ